MDSGGESPSKKKKKHYKRVKRVFARPNPLFEQWFTEWRDEAKAKNWKSQFLYQKALTSVKKYPLPLRSGTEAKMLESIGDKLAKMLDDKLKEHYAQHPSSQSSDEGLLLPGTSAASVGTNLPSLLDCIGTTVTTNSSQSSPTKQKPAQKAREYVPAVGSGAYAILIALYNEEMRNGPRAFMRKDELMDAAQPYTEKSFRVPEAGKHYTAWSSMSTIILKELVVKESCPAKYSLTDKGLELAKKLAEIQEKANKGYPSTSQKHVDDRVEPFASSESRSRVEFSADDGGNSQSSVTSCGNASRTSLEYRYVTDKGVEVREKSKAHVHVDGDMIGFLVKCKKQELFSSGKFFKLDVARPESGDYVYAYLHDSHAEETSPVNELPLSQTSSSSSASNVPSVHRDPPERAFALRPGSFDIVLCVDICETVSGAVNGRKLAVQQDLRKNGVDFDVRKLNVGDFAWVAREKVSVVPSQLRLPKAKELVLDFIIERKRMDDLASSIKDGRFHEQKYRLKNCGLHRPIYLVEGMGSGIQHSLSESALNQAIANTQIIDNFTVQQTANQAGTIRYLTVMTRYLQSLYSKKTLHACSYDALPKEIGRGDVCHLLTFHEFNSFSVKNKEMTIRDVFIRHLIQLRGLSLDKAIAIVEEHPTPSSIAKAYESCATTKDKENLLADIKFGMGRRKIGPKLSKTVSQLYCRSVLT